MKKKNSNNPMAAVLERLSDPNFFKEFDAQMEAVREEIAAKRKDTMISLRINSRVLAKIKEKAARCGIGYQTLISQVLNELVQGTHPRLKRNNKPKRADLTEVV
jgi:predicted DNA binding CopG/RHH family protein